MKKKNKIDSYDAWRQAGLELLQLLSGEQTINVPDYLAIYEKLIRERKQYYHTALERNEIETYARILQGYIYMMDMTCGTEKCMAEVEELWNLLLDGRKSFKNKEMCCFVYMVVSKLLERQERYVYAGIVIDLGHSLTLVQLENEINIWEWQCAIGNITLLDRLGRREEAVKHAKGMLDRLCDDKVVFQTDKLLGEELTKATFASVNQLLLDCAISKTGDYQDTIKIVEQTCFLKQIVSSMYANDMMWKIYAKYVEAMLRLKKDIPGEYLNIIEQTTRNVRMRHLHSHQDQIAYLYALANLMIYKYPDDKRKYMVYIKLANRIARGFERRKRSGNDFISSHLMIISNVFENSNPKYAEAECRRTMEKLIQYYSEIELTSSNVEIEQIANKYDALFRYAYIGLTEKNQMFEYRMNYKNILVSLIRLRNKKQKEKALLLRDKSLDDLKYYTLSMLEQILPEGSILIDFYDYCGYEMGMHIYDIKDSQRYQYEDITVIQKSGGLIIKNKQVPDYRKLKERLQKLLKLIETKSTKYTKLTKLIYEEIFEEFEEELSKATCIYICADTIWNQIPINLILEHSGKKCTKEIVYLLSVRSLFEKQAIEYGEKGCLLGSPDYMEYDVGNGGNTGNTGNTGNEGNTFRDLFDSSGNGKFAPLPYAGYEVRKIAGITNNAQFYEQKWATKFKLETDKRFVHIATHGIFSEKFDSPWYESGLAFAGANNKGRNNQKIYGDGILHSDEISRLDMEKTEVVVLSACNSGRNVLSKQMFEVGLHIAFGATGVKYVVSALWKVDDLATAILMGYFYEQWTLGENIAVALEQAKEKLRFITVKELVMQVQKDHSLFEKEQYEELVMWLSGMPEDKCLYESPFYWDAFVCYQYHR